MKPSLFWKIAGAFWLTLAVATLGIIVGFMIVTHPKPGSPGVFDQIRVEREQAARVALRYGGRPALDAVTASWSPEDRRRLQLVRGPGGELEPAWAAGATRSPTWRATSTPWPSGCSS
jgi:two-component system OmpR family sensor kinase